MSYLQKYSTQNLNYVLFTNKISLITVSKVFLMDVFNTKFILSTDGPTKSTETGEG